MASNLPPPQSRTESDTIKGDKAHYEQGVPQFYPAWVSVPTLSYPKELKNGVRGFPFIHLNIVDPVASAPRTQYAIGLYMPNSIKVAYNANWETIDLGLLGYEAFGAVNGGLPGEGSGWQHLINTISEAGFSAAKNAAGQVLGVNGANTVAGAQIAAGFQVNPHSAIMFKSMGLREFQLDFQFFPKNHEESTELRDIIFQLKYAMHPGLKDMPVAGGAMSRFWAFPNNFIIGFYRPDMKFMFRTSPCALINCSIDYNGSGVPAFFAADNRSVCITMSLHFRENEVLTKDRITQGW